MTPSSPTGLKPAVSRVAAGDAVCQAQAAAANLPDPTHFVALLSDSNNDAYCRLHGLTGQKSANCGLPSLPTYAGPWIATDGLPFATLQTLTADGAIISPALFAADGTRQSAIPFTGTRSGLIADLFTPAQCNNWTTNGNVGVGVFFGAGLQIFGGSSACASAHQLLCMHAGSARQLSYALPNGRQSFVTSTITAGGDLSKWTEAGGNTGIAAGDAICRNEAVANGVREPTSFKAWLSDGSVVPAINAIDRFQNDGPWVRLDGLPVAASKNALISGQMRTLPITVGATLMNGSSMLTGTKSDGTSTGTDCHGWNSAANTDSFTEGTAYVMDSWTNALAEPCDLSYLQLYCFSDLDRLFDSGMEGIPY